MAFGFPASYTTQIVLVGSRLGAREAIVGTFQALGWHHTVIGPDDYEVQMPMNGLSWGENLRVTLTNEGTAVITSKCRFPFQLFDSGQNKRNTNQFSLRFSIREVREAKLDYKDPIYLDDKGHTPVDRVIMERNLESQKKGKSGDAY